MGVELRFDEDPSLGQAGSAQLLTLCQSEALSALGLTQPILPALGPGLVCSIPVLADALYTHTGLNPHATVVSSLRTAVGSGLGAEVLYRGLLFLVLYRCACWSFWAVALANAAPSVVGRLYQTL